MSELKIYARDKNGNRGPLITTARYPSQEAKEVARRAIIWLCINRHKFPDEWNLKRCIAI